VLYFTSLSIGRFEANLNAKKKEKKLVISGQRDDVKRVKMAIESHLEKLIKEEFKDRRPGNDVSMLCYQSVSTVFIGLQFCSLALFFIW